VGGLAIVAVVGLYLVFAVWIVVKSPGWWRLVALLAILLVPSADSLWGRYVTLPVLCRDAGLKVYEKASIADGLRFAGAADDGYIIKYGFPFIEGRDAAGTYYRFSRVEGQDRALFERSVQPRAKYLVSLEELRPAANVTGAVLRVRNVTTGNPAGEIVTFGFGGGWAERLLSSFSDGGPGPMFRSGCDEGDFSYDRLFVAVFEPSGAK
jgi:hypothetical protein